MSDIKIVCLGRHGTELDTAGVYVLNADECNITYLGKKRLVFWSRPGNYIPADEERKKKKKGGERFLRCISFIDDPCEILPTAAAKQAAEELRDELEEKGELAVEGSLI